MKRRTDGPSENAIAAAAAVERPALDHAVGSRWYGGIKRFADVTLEATDTTWTAGSGDQHAAGAVIDLLLIATGCAAGLQGLSGPGVAPLQRRLDPDVRA